MLWKPDELTRGHISCYSYRFMYYISILNMVADEGCERDVVHRIKEGYKAWGALKSVLSNRELEVKARKCLCEGVIVPTALNGAEA